MNTNFLKFTRILSVLIPVIFSCSGCSSSSPSIQKSAVGMNPKSWHGDWFTTKTSYYKHQSTAGIRINSDGTGYVISSAIFEPRHNPSFVVSKHPFTWVNTSPSTLTLSVGSQELLAGDLDWGFFAKTRGKMALTATSNGLQLDGLGMNGANFIKYPKALGQDMSSAIVAETRSKSLSMGGNENEGKRLSYAEIAQGALNTYRQGLIASGSIPPGSTIPGSLTNSSDLQSKMRDQKISENMNSSFRGKTRFTNIPGKVWRVAAVDGIQYRITREDFADDKFSRCYVDIMGGDPYKGYTVKCYNVFVLREPRSSSQIVERASTLSFDNNGDATLWHWTPYKQDLRLNIFKGN